MARIKRVLTDAEARALFLEKLAATGHITRSCKAAGVPRRTIYNWRKADEAFAAAWDEAVELAIDALEDEAIRRAKDGVLKPVFQGGKKVGTVREYSDGLLQFLLKGKRPERYKDRLQSELSGPGGKPLPVTLIEFTGSEDAPLDGDRP
jgi:AcrR family transcriptional regulator